MKSTRAEVSLAVLLVIGLLGLGGWGLSKTKWFSRESKRAKTSTETTADLITAKDKQAAVAAASVVKIGEANAVAPESPSRAFIAREVPVALASLPAPDGEALLQAERRKAAILEGRLAEADRLYGDAMARADQYQKEAARAVAAKRASDLALEQAAAEARGAEQQAFWFTLAAMGAGALYVYTKLTHLSPGSLARVVADIRSGTKEENPALVAIDTHTGQLQQWATRGNVWLNSKLEKVFS
jgi:hypothetical protein